MRFILPQGIGDSVWALHKIQAVSKKLVNSGLGDDKIDVYLNCQNSDPDGVEARALDFVRRFKFVNSAQMLPGFSIHPKTGWIDEKGRYVYIPDGLLEYNDSWYYVMMPNGPLERGIRLEDWLPAYKINWGIMNDFTIEEREKELSTYIKKQLGEYAVFYLGPLNGNRPDMPGHNRGPIWTGWDWMALGRNISERMKIKVVLVGAPYDMSYYTFNIAPYDNDFVNMIGETNIGQLYSITRNARFMISYQAGVGIVSSYLGVPTGIFWRAKGDSISPNNYISFEEAMSYAWANPSMIRGGKHLPLIYGRHGADFIMSEIQRRGW